jgi:hypothetical protein
MLPKTTWGSNLGHGSDVRCKTAFLPKAEVRPRSCLCRASEQTDSGCGLRVGLGLHRLIRIWGGPLGGAASMSRRRLQPRITRPPGVIPSPGVGFFVGERRFSDCPSTPFARQVAASYSPLLRIGFLWMGAVLAPRTVWPQRLSRDTSQPGVTAWLGYSNAPNALFTLTHCRPVVDSTADSRTSSATIRLPPSC